MANDGTLQTGRGRVLIVDDQRSARHLLNALMERDGWSVDEAVNGQEAVQAFRRARYQIILMDIQMPVMTGIEATREIRSDIEKKSIKTPPSIVAVTAFSGSLHDFDRGLFDGIIGKPLSVTHFYQNVRQFYQ